MTHDTTTPTPDDSLDAQLRALRHTVPDAPDFVPTLARNLPPSPAPSRPLLLRPTSLLLTALAASLLILLTTLSLSTLTPQHACAQAIDRAARFESFRYTARSYYDPPNPNQPPRTDRITFATGNLSRSDLADDRRPNQHTIVIHNPQTLPDATLALYTWQKAAEFTPADQVRDARNRTTGSPIDDFRVFASKGVKAAPDETYHNRPARVFVSDHPEPLDDGRQFLTRRLLVDKQTNLPLRLEVTYDMTPIGQGVLHIIREDFEWSPPLPPDSFSTTPPPDYKVYHDLMRPLSHGLPAYAALSPDHHLPPDLTPATLAAFKTQHPTADADIDWAFSTPAYAAHHHLDLRYYGAGLTIDTHTPHKSAHLLVAAEIAPNTGQYEVLYSDLVHARLPRSQLP